MLYFANGVIVHLDSAPKRESILRALRKLPPLLPESSVARPLAVLSGPEAPVDLPEGVPVVRLWTQGREPGGENPFADSSVLHVVGVVPDVRPHELATTLKHLVHGDPIRLIDAVPAPTYHRTFRILAREHYLTARMTTAEVLRDAGAAARVADELATLVDELVLNAIYDAPIGDTGPLFRSVSRQTPVPIARPVDLELAANGRNVGIAVRDSYGSLDARDVLRNLSRCYSAGEQIDQKAGGAGLGLYMTLAGASRLIFNIDPGRMTEVVLVRDHTTRAAAFRQSAPTLNICMPPRPGKRREPRAKVRLLAQVRSTAGVGAFEVRDVTPQGAFLAPIGGGPFDTDLGIEVEKGVMLTVFEEDLGLETIYGTDWDDVVWRLQPKARDMAAWVRWVGPSKEHECYGFGVEFEVHTEDVGHWVQHGASRIDEGRR